MPKGVKGFQPGHQQFGGREKGSVNKVTRELRALLNTLLPKSKLKKKWEDKLNHADPQIAMRAFELALQYMYGKPAQLQTPSGEDAEAPPISINISAIPQHRVEVDEPPTRIN